jgi:biopolymer transport protein ExbD
MSASMMHQPRAEPNLVPMLDMVFQLITFFMLVVNFKGAETDLTLQLPIVGSARPIDNQGQDSLMVLNIDAQGRLRVYGAINDVKAYVTTEAKRETEKLLAANAGFKPGDELPTTVVIRADRAIPFKLLNEIVKTCQQNGYRKLALKSARKSQEG